MKHRALIVDFDGVVRLWNDHERVEIETRFELPPGAISAAAFEPSLFERALTGRIPDETWRLALRNALVRAHGEAAGAAADAWSARRGRLDQQMVELLTIARTRLRLGLLSNATTRLEADVQHFKLDKLFDVVVNSARVGFAKPDPRVYHVAAVRLGYLPSECIYVDDTAGHVEAACAFGMTGMLFSGMDELRGRLSELGLPV